jgi:hypothetical protein
VGSEYNPINGAFNRVDPYAGNMQDPQSLHKYAYVHNNPVNGIDPSGEVFVFAAICVVAIIGIWYFGFHLPGKKKARDVSVRISIDPDNIDKIGKWDSQKIQNELITTMGQLNIAERHALAIELVEESATPQLGWQSVGNRDVYNSRVVITNRRMNTRFGPALAITGSRTTEIMIPGYKNCESQFKSNPALAWSNVLAHEVFWLSVRGAFSHDRRSVDPPNEISYDIGSGSSRVGINDDSREKILAALKLYD